MKFLNSKTAAVISLIFIFIFCVAIFVAYSEEPAPDGMEYLPLKWEGTEHAEGYRLFVTTYYSKDRKQFIEEVYNTGTKTKITVLIDDIDINTGIVNICFELTAYGHAKGLYVESERSDGFCLKPWPVTGLKVKQEQ